MSVCLRSESAFSAAVSFVPGGGQLTASSESPVAKPTTGRPTASSTQVSGNSVLSSKSTRGVLQRQKDGQRDAKSCYHSSYNKKKL